MKCLILAAGYATRLYPLTENFPKPLLKVGEKSILDWLVDDIAASCPVDEFVVVSNHRFAHHFEEWAAGRSERIFVVDDGTSTNETRLGAVCDIRYAMEKLGIDDDILVVAGDNVLDFSLGSFVSYAREHGASAIMRYYEADEARLHKCGIVEIDADGKVVSMEEKPAEPKSHWCCPPFYYYRKEDASRIGEAIAAGCGTDAPGSLAAWLSEVSAVYAMEMPGKRYDIGNTESYRKVCEQYRGIL
jgi:glucose-1-phosphate thymidylyltransferase